ncbi:MAG TPA: PLP-dependent transferase, partial [Candidatus Dormibacteraeota bacterium]|nr:PLP-dependent transferase [Candidatus Dormibacteraeota bacterium]
AATLETVVPDFASVAELRQGLDGKARFENIDLYPRDGSELLGEVQARIAHLAGVDETILLSYNSGMSAVTEAIDVGLHVSDTEDPVVACSGDTYSQTKRYIEQWVREKRGKVYYFDSGDPENVKSVLDKRQPDVVVVETVANYLNVPVLDTAALVQQARESDKQPTLVIDNTLPLSTGLQLGEMINEGDRVIAVESGTKSYTRNGTLLGVGFTKNPELFDWLRRSRRTRGSVPVPEHLEKINKLLPESREDFDDRNRSLFANTGQIAINLAIQLPAETSLVVAHPELITHPNHDFYKRHFPDGGAPVIYVFSHKFDQYELAEQLWSYEDIRGQARLGQSFGFDHARIVTDENVRGVRIAGGAYTDGKTLGKVCGIALAEL